MDRKYLLATTSLVAASVLAGGNALAEAQPLNISLGGYYHFDAHLFDEVQDGGSNNHNMVTAQDAEVNFNMRGELDNGMKIGGRIELEASQAGDQIDQHWLTLESGWGRIDVGAINSGRYNLSWTVNAPNVAHGITSGVQTEWLSFDGLIGFVFRRPLGSANVDASNDDQGIHYYSPRFNGFQVALSYRPAVSTITSAGSGGANNYAADRAIDTNTDYTDAVDGAVHYTGDMGGVDVTALIGFATAAAPGSANVSDYEQVGGGFRISSQGFRVGGMVADVSNGFCVDMDTADMGTGRVNATCSDPEDRSSAGTAFTFGVSYSSGPWAVSAQVHSGEVEDSIGIAGSSELDVWSVGASYTLGPGLRMIASYQDAELSNEDGIAASGNSGNSFSLGIAAGF
jgi:predicted porin